MSLHERNLEKLEMSFAHIIMAITENLDVCTEQIS